MQIIKHSIRIILIITLLVSCNFKKAEQSQKTNPEDIGYKLVWSDEFEYNGLPDSSKWTYDTEGNSAGWGNNEAQFYTSKKLKNARVENGKLLITAHYEEIDGKQFSSVRLLSKEAWQYARIEVSAKLPSARGTWPAIWMMPGGWSFNDGNWPAVGEMDIMEHVGHDPGIIHASAHSTDHQWQAGTQKTGTILVPNATQEFNVYRFDWSADVMKAFVNDSLFFENVNEGLGTAKWPFNKPFYLILNIAVGGEWGNVKGIDTNQFPQTMEIDYVRVYQKK